jgi:phosphoglycolate phosphatase-like HAD superfamily hydrolase
MARILTELLPNHPQTIERGFKVPPFKHYAEWVNNPNSILSDEGLKQAIEVSTDSAIKKELSIAFEWSRKVNESTAAVAKDIQPFQYVRRCLERIVKYADIVVVSTAPVETLKREWRQHDIAGYVRMIAGQEMGSKEQQLAISAKYAINCSLMIGDALSDFKAARKNNCLFYPINPGDEVNSWKRLLDEGVDRFFNGTYAGDYEAKLFAEFDAHLPGNPPWKVI